MRWLLIPTLLGLGCSGGETDPPTPTDDDCTVEGSSPLSNVAVPDQPAGLQDAIQRYRELDGRWTASACGDMVNVTIRTMQILDSTLDVITTPLEPGNGCGCTLDPDEPNDGDLDVIARTTMDITVQNYPDPDFSEESAGNVANMAVSFFSSGDFTIRACATTPVPPILMSPYFDTELTFRAGPSGESGFVNIIGAGQPDKGCALTGWTKVGDN